MPLNLMYITNNPAVAVIAESHGVDRVMIDLETLGKEERQKNMNTVKSHHTLQDVKEIAAVLHSSEVLVRVNPWNEHSVEEINAAIACGAQRLMLPMWKSREEVEQFLNTVHKRVGTTLLLETKEAVACLDDVLSLSLLDEIHIGLNDLHLSYGLTFMFELLANGTVESICRKCKSRGIPYGFGGIAKIGEGTLPAEMIVTEHYRLGSTRTILSRSFCNAEEIKDLTAIGQIFGENTKKLRSFEETMATKSTSEYNENQQAVADRVSRIVHQIKEKSTP